MSYPIYVTKAVLVPEPLKPVMYESKLNKNEQIVVDLRRVTFVKITVKTSDGVNARVVTPFNEVKAEDDIIELDAIAVDDKAYIRVLDDTVVKIIVRGR